MKRLDTRTRPQSSNKLELRLETLRRLEATELAGVQGGQYGGEGWPTITRTVNGDI